MSDPTDLAETAAVVDGLAGTLGDLSGLSKTFGRSLTTALKGAIVQGRSLDVVLRSLAERLASKALDSALSPLTGGIAGLVGGLLGFADGGVIAAGRVRPFAGGGVVSSPTYFPMAGGTTGLMGEAGAEAILPLTRGSDGRLGVAAAGGSATRVTVNITTPDLASFRRSEAQVTGMMARAVGRGRRGL
jgi:phage-related minor tail protein